MRKTWFTALTIAAMAGALLWWMQRPAPERHLPEVPEHAAPSQAGELVVDLVDGATEADLQAVEAALGADLAWTSPLSIDEGLAQGPVPDLAAAVAALRGNPLVEVAEPLMQLGLDPTGVEVEAESGAAAGFPNDPMYGKQWHLRAMGAPEGWRTTSMGKGVIVAVVDTGVTQVEDLKGTRVLKGATFVPGTSSAADDQGHGTHVAGTIAQTTNNGTGVAGVAPHATILPIKVLSKQGFGQSSWIASGIDQAVDDGAQVINLSLGGGYSEVIHNAVKKARKKGVIVVAAAGNSGRKGVGYPGGLEETVGVSALGPDGSLAPYSSWGKGVDIAAPGGDTRKADGGVLQNTVGPGGKGERYAAFQGTSMATPHVAGAAAVLLGTGMDADAVEAALLESADGQGWDPKLGHGKLDLGRALTARTTSSGGLRFAMGLVIALLVGRLASARFSWVATAAVTAGLTAGGVFVLSWLPLPGHWTLNLLSTSFLEWPAVLGWPGLVHFPLWVSAAVPATVAFLAGAFRPTRAVAMGFAAGFAGFLFHAAATGDVSVWLFGDSLGTVWLVVNATSCVLAAMALAGAQKLDKENA